jgi:hypothetical protein
VFDVVVFCRAVEDPSGASEIDELKAELNALRVDAKQEGDDSPKYKHAQYMRYWRAVSAGKRKIGDTLAKALEAKSAGGKTPVSLFGLWIEHNEDPHTQITTLAPHSTCALGFRALPVFVHARAYAKI